jgi:hypothetical protein
MKASTVEAAERSGKGHIAREGGTMLRAYMRTPSREGEYRMIMYAASDA